MSTATHTKPKRRAARRKASAPRETLAEALARYAREDCDDADVREWLLALAAGDRAERQEAQNANTAK